MALHRPRVLQQVQGNDPLVLGEAYKDGTIYVATHDLPVTSAPDGAFLPSNWPYAVLGPERDRGVVIELGYLA